MGKSATLKDAWRKIQLLDQQLRQLEQQFIKEGGFTERLYRVRTEYRSGQRPPRPSS
jgi:four helix bundle suffix protein